MRGIDNLVQLQYAIMVNYPITSQVLSVVLFLHFPKTKLSVAPIKYAEQVPGTEQGMMLPGINVLLHLNGIIVKLMPFILFDIDIYPH